MTIALATKHRPPSAEPFPYLACAFESWPFQALPEMEGARTAGPVSACFSLDRESPAGEWVRQPAQGGQSEPKAQAMPFACLTQKTVDIIDHIHWYLSAAGACFAITRSKPARACRPQAGRNAVKPSVDLIVRLVSFEPVQDAAFSPWQKLSKSSENRCIWAKPPVASTAMAISTSLRAESFAVAHHSFCDLDSTLALGVEALASDESRIHKWLLE